MRISVQILLFDCSDLILRTIENCGPWVERIYVLTSRKPWTYNRQARSEFTNQTDPGVLRRSRFFSKIRLIEGEWATEEAQRNAGLDAARADGFDIMIVQDADEFYLPSEWERNLKGIADRPEANYFRNPWYVFWKNTRHVILHRWVRTYRQGRPVSHVANSLFDYNMCFALRIGSAHRFADRRMPTDADQWTMLDGVCHHLSYVMSDDNMRRKLATWGHHTQVTPGWFETKWLGWREESKHLSPFNAPDWVAAVNFPGPVPRELDALTFGPNEFRAPSLHARLTNQAVNGGREARGWLRAKLRS